MTRPALPELSKGDTLLMLDGTPGRRERRSPVEVRVVTVGRKYVHVVKSERYADPLPEHDRYWVRKFLIEDQTEGERGKRIGYSASVATAEQRAYDERVGAADEYLAEQGIRVERHSDSQWRDGDKRIRLAELVLGAVMGGGL